MTQTNPKTLIITILKDNILVYVDGVDPDAITGIVAGTWYDERIIGDHAWMVTVGPTILNTHGPTDIGANSWNNEQRLVVNIWIPILEGVEYTPERLKFSLVEEVKRLLKLKLVAPATDIKYLHMRDWRDLDDRKNDMLRVECTLEVEWEEA